MEDAASIATDTTGVPAPSSAVPANVGADAHASTNHVGPGASAGIAIELFGIAVALFGLAAGNLYFSGAGPAYQPNPVIAGIGALIALIVLIVLSQKPKSLVAAPPRPQSEPVSPTSRRKRRRDSIPERA